LSKKLLLKADPFFLYLDKIWQKTGIPEDLKPVILWDEWIDRIKKINGGGN